MQHNLVLASASHHAHQASESLIVAYYAKEELQREIHLKAGFEALSVAAAKLGFKLEPMIPAAAVGAASRHVTLAMMEPPAKEA